MHLGRPVLTAVATLLVAAACTSTTSAAPSTTTTLPATTTTTKVRGNVNGVLRVGVLLPRTGAAASLGLPAIEGARLAQKAINDAGGVLGHQVEISIRDEGSDLATASESLGQLLDDDVDAVIGPASSKNLLALSDRLISSGVLTCSPTATTSAVASLSTNHLLFRTMPADVLEASALSQAFGPTGRGSTAILYPDDAYGERMRDALRAQLARTGVRVTTAASYDNIASNADEAVATALASQPESVFVVGVEGPGGLIVSSLRAHQPDPAQLTIFVTSGMRRADLYQQVPPGRPDIVNGIMGVSPSSSVESIEWFAKEFKAFSPSSPIDYAAYAYDCLNLIALSASAAASDQPAAIGAQMEATSRGGALCHEFASCNDLANQKRNIDYDGASGPVDLQATGDVEQGWFDVFSFDAAGRDIRTGQLLGG